MTNFLTALFLLLFCVSAVLALTVHRFSGRQQVWAVRIGMGACVLAILINGVIILTNR